MPRSGSTLVEQIVASHSQAFGAGARAPKGGRRPRLAQAASFQEPTRPGRSAALRAHAAWLPLPPPPPKLLVSVLKAPQCTWADWR